MPTYDDSPTILLADDHPMFRAAVREGLERAGLEVVAEAQSGRQAVDECGASQPSVAVIDLTMPGVGGLVAIREINERSPNTQVVVLSAHRDRTRVNLAYAEETAAYLSKDAPIDVVVETVLAVAGGRRLPSHRSLHMPDVDVRPDALLTPRQRDLLQLAASGLSLKESATELGISVKTVHNHLNDLYRRLDAQSLTDAVVKAARLGLIDLDEESV